MLKRASPSERERELPPGTLTYVGGGGGGGGVGLVETVGRGGWVRESWISMSSSSVGGHRVPASPSLRLLVVLLLWRDLALELAR